MDEIHWGKVLTAVVASSFTGMVLVALFAIKRLLGRLVNRLIDKWETR